MLFELIIVVCVAFAVCGTVLLVSRLLGIKLHKSVIPIVAGLSVIGFTIYSRYTWGERTAMALPERLQVISTVPYDGILEPWTKIYPRTGALMVLDTESTLRNPDQPHIVMVSLLLIEQYADTIQMRQFVDCAGMRRAPVVAEGLPSDDLWIRGGEPRALYDAVCSRQAARR